jgi:predicted ester cyclase
MIHFKSSSLFALTVAMSLGALIGCEEQKAATKSEPVAEAPKPAVSAKPASLAKTEEAKPLTGSQVAEWYGKCWDLWNGKKWDEFSKCYAEDAVAMRGTNPGFTVKGRTDIIEKDSKQFAAAFPDIKGERQLTLVNGNKVAAMALIQGTHTAPLVGPNGTVPATNKKLGQMMLHTIEVNAKGEAAKQWEVSDSPTFMAQLGLSKQPARAALAKLPGEPEVVIAKNDETEAKNVANHKKAYELFSKHDKGMLDLVADDIAVIEYGQPTDVKGKKAFAAFLDSNWKGFSDMKLSPDEVWGAGDYTFALLHMTGTNDGDIAEMKLKKTGKAIDVRVGEIVKWKDGKAVAAYPFMDGMDIASQLGLVGGPGAEGKAAAAAPADKAAAPAEKAAAPAGKAAAPASK